MRTVDSLRRKFSSLHCKKIQTGNYFTPDDFTTAKNIRISMTERADIGCGDEDVEEITEIQVEGDAGCTETEMPGGNENTALASTHIEPQASACSPPSSVLLFDSLNDSTTSPRGLLSKRSSIDSKTSSE